MRAIRFDGSLKYEANHPEPKPGEDEALIRVRLAGVCGTDFQIVRGYMSFRGILGHEFVGTVVDGPSQWKNKRVVCEINCVCRKCDMCVAGLSSHCRKRTVMGILGRDGCFADHVAMPVRNLHAVPDAVSDEEAVFVEPLAAAYQVLAQCPIDRRMNVSVIGPGRLGLLVAQVIRVTGCKLSVIGRNPMKLEMCEKLGIQPIHIDDLAARQDRDVVVDCTGSPAGLDLCMALVRPRGKIVLKSTCAGAAPINLSPLVINEVTIIGSRCGLFPEAINALARKAVEVKPFISRVDSLEQGIGCFSDGSREKVFKTLIRVTG